MIEEKEKKKQVCRSFRFVGWLMSQSFVGEREKGLVLCCCCCFENANLAGLFIQLFFLLSISNIKRHALVLTRGEGEGLGLNSASILVGFERG